MDRTWRRSSRSAGQGNCVELVDAGSAVAVRDSKNPGKGYFEISRRTFAALTHAIKTDRL